MKGGGRSFIEDYRWVIAGRDWEKPVKYKLNLWHRIACQGVEILKQTSWLW